MNALEHARMCQLCRCIVIEQQGELKLDEIKIGDIVHFVHPHCRKRMQEMCDVMYSKRVQNVLKQVGLSEDSVMELDNKTKLGDKIARFDLEHRGCISFTTKKTELIVHLPQGAGFPQSDKHFNVKSANGTNVICRFDTDGK